MKKKILLAFGFFPVFCFSQHRDEVNLNTIFCSTTKIIFNNRCKEQLKGISIVHVHEDETTAVQAANWLLDSVKKGCFVTWQCHQQRFVDFKMNQKNYRFDPNRIYTFEGIKATLKMNGDCSDSAIREVQSVADTFLQNYITGKKLVIALHNNTNGGGLSVLSYRKSAPYSKDAKMVFVNPKRDPDDFFYTTEQAYFDYFKGRGFNIVLQDNANVKNDGSLSVYCSSQNTPYLNIEAQQGHLQEQQAMLKAVWQLIIEKKM